MKKFTIITLLFLSVRLSIYSQQQYIKSIDVPFSGGNNGAFSGNAASDIVCSIDAINGELDVAVNKVNYAWSVLRWYTTCCWGKYLVFDQTNRYIEFRVKCDKAQTTPMSVNTWGTCDGGCAETKTWPGNTFTIPKTNIWTIVFLKVPPTSGGSQNIIDTISTSYAWSLENGNYSFDYFKFGIAAIPVAPVMNEPKTVYVCNNTSLKSITLSGIKIPDRMVDGLTITLVPRLDTASIIYNDSFADSGSYGPLAVDPLTNTATCKLLINIDTSMVGHSDSIRVILKDTIRNTSAYYSFKVAIVNPDGNCAEASADIYNIIAVYPTNTNGMVTVEIPDLFTGVITVIDLVGNIISSQIVTAAHTAKVDLSSAVSGIYIIRISDGKDVVTKKVIKQ